MMTKIRDLFERRKAGEKGFTLIELLVVIIIIGILAAVATPIFLNQQRSAVDAAVTADIRNVATNIETLRVKHPTSTTVSISDDDVTVNPGTANSAVDGNNNGVVRVWLENDYIDVSISEGTHLRVGRSSSHDNGNFIIRGWNPDGNYDGTGINHDRDAISYLSYNGKIVTK